MTSSIEQDEFQKAILEKIEIRDYDPEWPSRDLRNDLIAHLERGISYGSFYTKMQHLVDAGSVRARDDSDADGRRRHYSISGGRRFMEKQPEVPNIPSLDGLTFRPGT